MSDGDNREVVDLRVKYFGDGGDHGVEVVFKNGSRKNDKAHMTKEKATEVCQKFRALRRAGTGVHYEDWRMGTPGYRVRGKTFSNFLSEIGDID